MDRPGQVSRTEGRPRSVLESIDHALVLAPDGLANRGLILLDLRQWAEAQSRLVQALSRQPDNVAALASSGDALLALDRPADALRQFERVAALQPNLAKAHGRAATALTELNRLDEALVSFRQARTIGAPSPGAEWNEPLVRLALGDYRLGWLGYEQRWSLARTAADRPLFSQPSWLEERPIAGRTILLLHEHSSPARTGI